MRYLTYYAYGFPALGMGVNATLAQEQISICTGVSQLPLHMYTRTHMLWWYNVTKLHVHIIQCATAQPQSAISTLLAPKHPSYMPTTWGRNLTPHFMHVYIIRVLYIHLNLHPPVLPQRITEHTTASFITGAPAVHQNIFSSYSLSQMTNDGPHPHKQQIKAKLEPVVSNAIISIQKVPPHNHKEFQNPSSYKLPQTLQHRSQQTPKS